MKTLLLVICAVFFLGLETQSGPIESKVYSFSKAKVEKTSLGEKRQLIDGNSTHMESFEIHATTLNPGKEFHASQIHPDSEELIIVKEGKLKVTLNNNIKVLGPGSVVLVMPGDEHGLDNAGDTQATYYIVKYKSKAPMDITRGKMAGGSLVVDWDTLTFSPHDKGGIRRYFDRKSAMSNRIEMHMTTLNPGIKSHDPHTHTPAEIVVMMDGKTEMEIDSKLFQGQPGDIYFLESGHPHAIRNTGDKPCMYMAFQWE
jgi:(S)-ureidoglycine aminohydrolase